MMPSHNPNIWIIMFDWLINPKYSVLADWLAALGTMLATIVALYVATIAYRKEERKRRRNVSVVGVVIMDQLLEEVRTGLRIMEDTLRRIETTGPSPTAVAREMLPNASWEGMNTISDSVLLRIVATANGVQPRSFPLEQVRVHCKNYFVHMRENFNHVKFDAELQDLLVAGKSNYIGAAKGVIAMLEQVRELLNENQKRRRPK